MYAIFSLEDLKLTLLILRGPKFVLIYNINYNLSDQFSKAKSNTGALHEFKKRRRQIINKILR